MLAAHRHPSSRLILGLTLGLAACEGGISPRVELDAGQIPDAGVSDAGQISDAGAPDPVIQVPAVLPSVSARTECKPLLDGEAVLGVSPDGHLWLGATSSTSAALRALDPWAPQRITTVTVPAPDLARVHAVSATVATYVSGGELYRLEDGVRTRISAPARLAADAAICGDPARDALVFSAGTLYQRIDDQWLEWTGLDAALDASARLLAKDGACAAGTDDVWFANDELELWALAADTLSRPGELEGGTQPALLGSRALALSAGHLFVGPETWQEYDFELGEAALLAAGGDYAWLRVEDRLLRFDGDSFVDVGTATDAVALWPSATGGLWTEGAGLVCHHEPQGSLRIECAHSGTRSQAAAALVRAFDRDGLDVTGRLDGVEVQGRSTDTGTVFSVQLSLGWHALTLSAGDTRRTVYLARTPSVVRSFADDVQPIFQAHCAGCHLPDNRFGAPDLSTLEAWRIRATKIRERVLQVGDMPPSASRSPDWGEDEVTVIDEWLSGGMNP